jgi:hypothetical protein
MALLTTNLLDTKAYDFSILRLMNESHVHQSGIVDKGDFAVTAKASQPPMGVTVAAGQAWVRATTGTRNGAYHIVNDASVDINLTAADATNPRVDRIILRINDTSDLASATDNASLEAVVGTPTAGATLANLNGAPALPANSLNLAFVLVGAGVTSVTAANIGNLADPFGVAAGYAAVSGAVAGAPPGYAFGRPARFVPYADVFHNANQSVANASAVTVAFNSERIDNDGCHDNATNNSRITIQTPGLYSLSSSLGYAANATGLRYGYIRLNGTTIIGFQTTPALSAGGAQTQIARQYRLGYGDYVEAQAYQSSGGALNVETQNNYSPTLSAVWVGP